MEHKTHRPIGGEQGAEEPTEGVAGTGGLPGGGGKGEGKRRHLDKDAIRRRALDALEADEE